MLGRGFTIFWIFLLFFSEFSYPGRVWTELRTKIYFFSFSAYLIPFWLRIMLGSGFLIFLLFFSIFSCPGRVWTELGSKSFFFYFLAYLILFWLKIMPGRGFLIFFEFFYYFCRNFLARVEYKRNAGQNLVFFLFRPISSRFG